MYSSCGIPGILSVTSTGLKIEGAVVAVGDSYYIHETRAIEKRTIKRKREGTNTIHGSSERVINWKKGHGPKYNALQKASTLNAFVGANFLSVYDVTGSLDTAKTRIVEIEANMRIIKDTLTNEFRK
jgi:hypothetical protein